MESKTKEVIKTRSFYDPTIAIQFKKLQWAGFRLIFLACTLIGATTVVGGFLFSPFYSYWFFGSFRFWRYLHMWPGSLAYAYYICYTYLKGDFALSVSFTAPPLSKPHGNPIQINPDWESGESCGSCSKCCRKIKCPLLEKETGKCMSYDTFYWRYFNCGRYPESQIEIDRYECPKWVVR